MRYEPLVRIYKHWMPGKERGDVTVGAHAEQRDVECVTKVVSQAALHPFDGLFYGFATLPKGEFEPRRVIVIEASLAIYRAAVAIIVIAVHAAFVNPGEPREFPGLAKRPSYRCQRRRCGAAGNG